MKKGLVIVLILGLLAAGVFLRTLGAERRPNVVIVLSDSLRRDHLGCYGYERNTSEHIDAFASDALVHERAYSQAPSTKPSVASLFTSRYVSEHGVVGNADSLSPDLTTLAEVLAEAGYVTAGFLETITVGKPETGYDRGFQTWWLEPPPDETERESTFEAFDARVRAWVDEHREEEFFLYLHYLDPHSPYEPLPSYAGSFGDPDSTELLDHLYAGQRVPQAIGAGTHSAWGVSRYADRYDEEIRFVDDRFGKLIRHLEAGGLLDDSLVFFVSDHGEAFGEHGYLHHSSSVHAEQIDIPFIVRYPRSRSFRRQFPEQPLTGRTSAPAQHVDVFPTVLDALGVDAGGFEAAGRSLLAEARSDEGAWAVSEHLREGWGPARVRALVKGRWKLIHDLDGDRYELFDLETDGRDLVDVSGTVAAREVADLKTSLQAWRDGLQPESGPGRVELDEEGLEELRALGYVE